MKPPSTIKHPEAFDSSPAAGFDGIFDWSWTKGCFGDTIITPMDIDALIERHGQFLLIETKGLGVPIPKGQLITLESLYRMRCFTVMIIYGKTSPESGIVWFPKDAYQNPPSRKMKKSFKGVDEAQQIVKKWYHWADAQ